MKLSQNGWPLLPFGLLGLLVLAWCAPLSPSQLGVPQSVLGVSSTNSSGEGQGQKPPSVMVISPEEAFRKGILSLKGEVDIRNTNGLIKFYRTHQVWYMQVTKYPGVPLGGIWIQINDDGTVERGYGF
jgi:hypothetical protein